MLFSIQCKQVIFNSSMNSIWKLKSRKSKCPENRRNNRKKLQNMGTYLYKTCYISKCSLLNATFENHLFLFSLTSNLKRIKKKISIRVQFMSVRKKKEHTYTHLATKPKMKCIAQNEQRKKRSFSLEEKKMRIERKLLWILFIYYGIKVAKWTIHWK